MSEGTIRERLGMAGFMSFEFETPPHLKVGDEVETKSGLVGKVLGVGLIDYAPGGPAYEVVEMEDKATGKRVLAFAVDLYDVKEDDDEGAGEDLTEGWAIPVEDA